MRKDLQLFIAGSIITIIGIILGAYMDNYFNAPYVIPNEPIISRIWLNDDNQFSQQQLCWTGDEVTKIEFCAYNNGRAPTGNVYIHLEYTDKNFSGGSANLGTILGGETNCGKMSFYSQGVFSEPEERCNESFIQTGNYSLNFVLECDYCKEKIQKVLIDICIWGENSKECER